MTWKASGPFDTERDAARATARWNNDVDAPDSEARKATRRARLFEALDRTGIPRAQYDLRIVEWAGACDDIAVEVVASLIERAYEAGAEDAYRLKDREG